MKIKVWVLSTILCDDFAPALPRVFGSEAEAEVGFDEAMRGEWDAHKPTSEAGDPLPYPGNPRDALNYLANDHRGDNWGLWELTSHEVTIPDAEPATVIKAIETLTAEADCSAEDYEVSARTGKLSSEIENPNDPEDLSDADFFTRHASKLRTAISTVEAFAARLPSMQKAVATLSDAAAAYADDLESGLEDGTYDEDDNPERIRCIRHALKAVGYSGAEA